MLAYACDPIAYIVYHGPIKALSKFYGNVNVDFPWPYPCHTCHSTCHFQSLHSLFILSTMVMLFILKGGVDKTVPISRLCTCILTENWASLYQYVIFHSIFEKIGASFIESDWFQSFG